jgi:hypothetical protein
MLAHGSAARSSTLSLWLSVTMMTGWPSSLGLRSMDSTSPLLARATVAVVQMAYSGLRDGLSTLTGVVGCALFMLLGPGLLLSPDLPSGGVPARRSGELLPEPGTAPGLLASAWQGRIAARPQVMLQSVGAGKGRSRESNELSATPSPAHEHMCQHHACCCCCCCSPPLLLTFPRARAEGHPGAA